MRRGHELEIAISCFCQNGREIALMLSKDHPYYAAAFQKAADYAQRIHTYLTVHGEMPPPQLKSVSSSPSNITSIRKLRS